MATQPPVWSDIEDQVLRATVRKYGLGQWERVLDLLASKTPEQCHERWEYLELEKRRDGRGWTEEENEHLLFRGLLTRNQWTLMGPVMGRTVQECHERYESRRMAEEVKRRLETEAKTVVVVKSEPEEQAVAPVPVKEEDNKGPFPNHPQLVEYRQQLERVSISRAKRIINVAIPEEEEEARRDLLDTLEYQKKLAQRNRKRKAPGFESFSSTSTTPVREIEWKTDEKEGNTITVKETEIKLNAIQVGSRMEDVKPKLSAKVNEPKPSSSARGPKTSIDEAMDLLRKMDTK